MRAAAGVLAPRIALKGLPSEPQRPLELPPDKKTPRSRHQAVHELRVEAIAEDDDGLALALGGQKHAAEGALDRGYGPLPGHIVGRAEQKAANQLLELV